jgi:tellurite resistance-related uncharacterized protein
MGSMLRTIIGFHQDDESDWVAELDCGHNQHLRHRPPWQERTWVLKPSGRAEHLDTPIECPLCDRAELPVGMRSSGVTALWSEQDMPASLRRSHRLPKGRWGLLHLEQGTMHFWAATEPALDLVLSAPVDQPIPPTVAHEIEPLGDVRFRIEWLTLPENES